MRFFALALGAALAPSVLAGVLPEVRPVDRPSFGCGTRDPTVEELQIAQHFAEIESVNNTLDARQTVNVGVYFHVVAASTSLSDGYLTSKMLSDQFKVLQDAFAPHGFTFTLLGTDFTINSNWANDGNELAMKRQLRKGSYKDLNIYFHKTLGGNFGYCYFPTTASPGSTAFIQDGCSILYTTVPGGSAERFNLGLTVVHEAGHWFGLYHTFQGGCTGAGDSVSDTPAQASATSGCPVGRDSCPNQSGVDPIHNYMDYSDDPCYDNFTPGQRARMRSSWNAYRA